MALGLNIPPDPSALRLLLRALFEQRWKLRQLAERSEIRVLLHVLEVGVLGGKGFSTTFKNFQKSLENDRKFSRRVV